jgi:hypothetical protein
MEVKHKVAKGLILWLMRTRGFNGFTTYWNTIYYIDNDAKNNEQIKRHELKHIEQMNKEGKILFSIKYLYYLIRFGYYKNPYEIEAREFEQWNC